LGACTVSLTRYRTKTEDRLCLARLNFIPLPHWWATFLIELGSEGASKVLDWSSILFSSHRPESDSIIGQFFVSSYCLGRRLASANLEGIHWRTNNLAKWCQSRQTRRAIWCVNTCLLGLFRSMCRVSLWASENASRSRRMQRARKKHWWITREPKKPNVSPFASKWYLTRVVWCSLSGSTAELDLDPEFNAFLRKPVCFCLKRYVLVKNQSLQP